MLSGKCQIESLVTTVVRVAHTSVTRVVEVGNRIVTLVVVQDVNHLIWLVLVIVIHVLVGRSVVHHAVGEDVSIVHRVVEVVITKHHNMMFCDSSSGMEVALYGSS